MYRLPLVYCGLDLPFALLVGTPLEPPAKRLSCSALLSKLGNPEGSDQGAINKVMRPTGSLLSIIADQVTQHTDEAVERSATSSPSAT